MKKSTSTKKVGVGTKKHGGARQGSGRKPSAERAQLLDLKTQIEQHAQQLVDVVLTKNGRQTIEKKTRILAIMDMLVNEAVKNKSIPAAKEYLDRTLGKSLQPIEHSGEIDTHEQHMPGPVTKALLAAQSAFHDALND
ncbi:hypothetical protein KAU11_10325 [Candidatus Babeliales bacterium]|nr:hypothetical protein [Candidatus Babeliales bacterium]